MQYAPDKTTPAVTSRWTLEDADLPRNTTMSLRQPLSTLARGWQAARCIARAVVRLESYVTAGSLEALKRERLRTQPPACLRRQACGA